MKCIPMRWTPMRHTPMRYTPLRCTPERFGGKSSDLPPYKRWCGGRVFALRIVLAQVSQWPTAAGDYLGGKIVGASGEPPNGSFDTSTTVSPLERKMPHNLSVPETPTRLPREPPSQKTPLHQRQFTLTIPPPQFMREATAHAFDPQLATVSIPGLDTPAQSVFSEDSTVTKESSPITPGQQDTVLDETAQEPAETIMAKFTDPFFKHAELETNDLKTLSSPCPDLDRWTCDR